MSEDKTFRITVDGKELDARPGQMLIEITDASDIYVPRFCYHKKLSVAANCRMCLVEVEKAPKPLPACATPVMDGMVVQTKSDYAREAQQSVMEFLLINHPLDCPICDQGGECELQDLAMGYGSDVSRYQENKRVVKDKNIGPLVQTDMTRCIHCTRCVRFGEEIAGLRELGGTGRGEHMEIGTYIEKSMTSELSGNVIDVCPVGALTSKPFRFSARTWEMKQYSGIAPHDAVGSNIHFHVKGSVVKRVVPAENEAINEVWLSDRDRFSYEGMYSEDRLHVPMIKVNNEWEETNWETAFDTVKERLSTALLGGANNLGALASASSTTEELYLFQKLVRGLGSNNIDHRLRQSDFSDQTHAPLFPGLGMAIADLENLDAALVIAGNPRKEQPMVNHRLRKAALKGADVMMINARDYALNYDLSAKIITAPAEFISTLAGVAAALLEAGNGQDPELQQLVQGYSITEDHREIAAKLGHAESSAVILGDHAIAHVNRAKIHFLAAKIAGLANASLGAPGHAANSAGAWLAGVLPHRATGGEVINDPGMHTMAMLEARLPAYILMNLEPELDCWDGQLAKESLKAADFVVSLTAYQSAAMHEYADVLLPISCYAENEGALFNMEARQQIFPMIVPPQGESRPAWKVLRVLGHMLECEGMDYRTVSEVRDEVNGIIGGFSVANLSSPPAPMDLKSDMNGLQRTTDYPMNSIDSLVRRAGALQQTHDIADGAIHINSTEAARLGLEQDQQAQIKQNGHAYALPVVIDECLPDLTVLIQAGSVAAPLSGEITVSKD